MARLSVIIPCFNGFEYLKQMVDCCCNQTYKDWELIVVDDGSTDGTFENIKEFSLRDTRINVYQRAREPKGSVTCRNIGFEKSTGEFIIHFDADDLFTNDCFEKRVAYMDTHPDCEYATFLAQGFSIQDGKKKMEAYYGVPKDSKDLLERFLTVHYPFSIWCNIYRREVVAKFPWDETVKVYSDFSYAIPMILAGVKHSFAECKLPDYYYRRFYSKNNMCASAVNEDKCKSTLYLFDKTLSSLSKLPDAECRKNQFLSLIVLHFDRLLSGNNKADLGHYVEMLSKHYPAKIINKFKRTCRYYESNNYKLGQIKISALLYFNFGFPIYRAKLIHAIGKLILGK